MMTLAFLAYVVARQDATPPPTGASLISKMLARYASASSLEGTIKTTQTARGISVTTTTTIAYEKPSKLLIVQKQGGSAPKMREIVSNGDRFFYTRPDRLMTAENFLGELVKPDERPAQTVGDLYTIVAAELPDRSPVLDFLIARYDDMVYAKAQFASFSYKGKVQIGDRWVHSIKGKWQENGLDSSLSKGAVGDFELYLGDDGELVRYVLVQNFAVPAQGPGQTGLASDPIEVVNVWDASVVLNQPIKPETFALKSH